MAPIKFEEHLKNVLEKRAIEPKHNSWNELSKRLENKKNNTKKGFWWLGIAASFLILVFFSAFYFNQNTNIIEPVMVNDSQNIFEEEQKIPNKKSVVLIPKIEKNVINKTVTNIKKPKKIINNIKNVKQKGLVSNIEINTFSLSTAAVETATATSNLNVTESKVSSSIQELNVAKQILKEKIIESEKEKAVTAEVNTLLTEAQNRIHKNKIIRQNSIFIDANALLESVEKDTDRSFRDKVFKKIKLGYNTLKVAVVERNN